MGVLVGVRVLVAFGVRVGRCVLVAFGVLVLVTVRVGVLVFVPVFVTVLVNTGVRVRVLVGTKVGELGTKVLVAGTKVCVRVAVLVLVGGTAVAVGVTVGCWPHPTVTMLSSSVTLATRAYKPPRFIAPVFRPTIWSATMSPAKIVSVPSVAELPTCQKIRHGCAPLIGTTTAELAVISVVPIWNTHTEFGSPWPSRMRIAGTPVRNALEAKQ